MSYLCSIHDILNTLEQPFEDADEIYNHNLRLVLDFFASNLQLYYSSSRLTLLVTSLYVSPDSPAVVDYFPWADSLIPLPPRLKAVDNGALRLHRVLDLYDFKWSKSEPLWKIFLDFLDSGHPLALDGRRYATAAWSCLNIIFKIYQLPVLRFAWFSQHSRLRIFNGSEPIRRQGLQHQSEKEFILQNLRSDHLQFLLEKSAYSNNLLNFARRRVFRFRYLHRKHPIYMKKAIFALAKYIQRVTGSTAEVSACESVWGRKKWFTAAR